MKLALSVLDPHGHGVFHADHVRAQAKRMGVDLTDQEMKQLFGSEKHMTVDDVELL